MCHDWSQEYTECRHASRKLINCPTHYKQQSSAKGFLGCIFRNNIKSKKHCGRVIPHYAESRPFCPDCTVRIDQLRAKHVGEGALKVYRPDLDNDYRRPFKEYRERRRQVAGAPPRRPERHVGRDRERHDHVATNTTHGVWVPELYHHPEMLARRETRGRAAEAAMPTSSSRPNKQSAAKYCSHKPEKGGNKSKVNEHNSKKSHKRSCRVPTNETSTRNRSQLLQGPARRAPTHHYQRRKEVVGSGSTVPPAPEPPPKPPRPQIRRGTGSRQKQKQYNIARKPLPPTPRPADPSRSEPPNEHPNLRRKTGGVHNISPQRPPPIPVPLPAYQVYLNAFRENLDTNFERVPQLPKPPPKKKYRHVKEELMNSGLRKMIGIAPSSPDSAISDASFMCQDSKRLTDGQSAAGRR
ncbi:hypothetical protein F4781DRAFT_355040 [Annulohypoxylon bovei var. microspora]|nr:hypothetical protein F4781DRAFT_355040 [Annulohypoxylon bovei var. microspora]